MAGFFQWLKGSNPKIQGTFCPRELKGFNLSMCVHSVYFFGVLAAFNAAQLISASLPSCTDAAVFRLALQPRVSSWKAELCIGLLCITSLIVTSNFRHVSCPVGVPLQHSTAWLQHWDGIESHWEVKVQQRAPKAQNVKAFQGGNGTMCGLLEVENLQGSDWEDPLVMQSQ